MTVAVWGAFFFPHTWHALTFIIDNFLMYALIAKDTSLCLPFLAIFLDSLTSEHDNVVSMPLQYNPNFQVCISVSSFETQFSSFEHTFGELKFVKEHLIEPFITHLDFLTHSSSNTLKMEVSFFTLSILVILFQVSP